VSNHYSAANLKFPGDDARLDFTDLFVFASPDDPDKTVLVADMNPYTTGMSAMPPFLMKSGFHPDGIYRINIDTDGDAQADAAFTFVFSELVDGRQVGTAYFAKIAGGDVTVIDAAPDKVELTKALGFRTFSVSELESAEFTAIKQTGFDAVLDATGSIRAMNASLFHTRSGGSYTLVGVIKGDLVWPDSEVHRRELTIRGSRNATKADFDHVMDSIRRGLVPTDRLATHATDMDKVIDDLPRWVHARDGLIKAIITV